ncbi:MAG: hypothetical protein ABI355_05555 [Solirubrobacteraceae bacterium]
MRRSLVLVLVTLASGGVLAAAGPASAATLLPALFARQIAALNRSPAAPAVLLPASLALDARHLFPSGGPSGRSYDLELGAVRGCRGADACFVAAFTASRASTTFGRAVTVRGASRAGFVPLSCGASCSPPQIDFLVHGIRYTIQARLRTSRGDRAAFVAAAESAIAAGPRVDASTP